MPGFYPRLCPQTCWYHNQALNMVLQCRSYRESVHHYLAISLDLMQLSLHIKPCGCRRTFPQEGIRVQAGRTARSSQENIDLSDSRWYRNVIARLLGCLHSSWPWKRDATVFEDHALMMMIVDQQVPTFSDHGFIHFWHIIHIHIQITYIQAERQPLMVHQRSTDCILKTFKPGTQTLSMSSARPSGIGLAFMNRRLCLLGDFERHTLSDSSLTVSRYETTGSETFSGMQAWSSSRSFRQISRCSSPAPATMCSPDSSIEHWTTAATYQHTGLECFSTKTARKNFFAERVINVWNSLPLL